MNQPNRPACGCDNTSNPAFFSRRQFLSRFGMGLGGFALAEMLARESAGSSVDHGVLGEPHFPAKAKRIIYLFMSGGPSQLDLFDYKPLLNKRNGEQLPDSVRGGQRLTGMSGNQSSIPLVGSPYKFTQKGPAGAWFSELLPHTAGIADKLCFIRAMYTEAINHGPGVTFLQTGSANRRPAEHGRMAQLWPGTGKRRLAFIRRAHHEGQRRPALGNASLGERVSCRPGIKASSFAHRATRSFTSTIRPA